MTTKRLFQVKDMVEQVLVAYPETRNDDDLLIAQVYRVFFGITNESFKDVLLTRKMRKLPSFESIRRCRQKLQEEYEFLRGTKRTQNQRFEKQVEYLELAQGGVNG